MRGLIAHSLHSARPAHMEKVSNPPPAIYPLRAGLHPQKDNLDKLVRLLYFLNGKSAFLTIYKNTGGARRSSGPGTHYYRGAFK
ncbi:hypothetical protein [Pusillimonas noertemannii]|uniref:Uncharacterized protein n=1 Tax=Pusillimonas noertemannii TaxID=305977 RepID=A0A2U1CPW5_9BURK|nr:hypothetical protein [Pusillimonas noertemannii]NYT67255.1 hypothetical protein [Pusillimonas noertemannii]PVY67928.1 hypothetical protein C7440_0314 [Pusillimonas noertemannii]TFL12550.1 hypothetical protein CSC72_05475 [Pusillimonas noertemannii]